MDTPPHMEAEPRRELIAWDVGEMTAKLCRLRNDYFDKFGLPEHATRYHALREFLWDNKTGICAALSTRPAPAAEVTPLPRGAVVIGPNTISGLPHMGGSGDFCPPWRDPQFDTHAARVAIWFDTWKDATNFVRALAAPPQPADEVKS